MGPSIGTILCLLKKGGGVYYNESRCGLQKADPGKKERKVAMKVEQLEDITIDQQQAVFGAYDTLIAIVERALMVTIGLHNSVVELSLIHI